MTGRALYAADHDLPGHLDGVTVGGSHSVGWVTGIAVEPALRVPGVVRAPTAGDMPRFGEVTAPASSVSLSM